MALDGSVGEFNPAREDWNTYVECLKFYFEANGVEAAAKKRSIFLSTSGAERFKLVCSLAAPSTPRELTFAQLVDLLNEHYNPKKAAAVQRYKFNSRISQPGESIATYVAGLKKLAVHYGFEEDTMKQMLCDRLVCGINDSRMQRRLLTELRQSVRTDSSIGICRPEHSRPREDSYYSLTIDRKRHISCTTR